MAAHHAKAAIVEAIEAEVPLIVAVAEHIPLHDILEVSNYIQEQPGNQPLVPWKHTPYEKGKTPHMCSKQTDRRELRSTQYSRLSLHRDW